MQTQREGVSMSKPCNCGRAEDDPMHEDWCQTNDAPESSRDHLLSSDVQLALKNMSRNKPHWVPISVARALGIQLREPPPKTLAQREIEEESAFVHPAHDPQGALPGACDEEDSYTAILRESPEDHSDMNDDLPSLRETLASNGIEVSGFEELDHR